MATKAAANDVVTIRSSDGQEFTISESQAALCTTLDQKAACGSTINLSNVDGKTLAMAVAYLKGNTGEIKFDQEVFLSKRIDVLQRLQVAADSLGIEALGDQAGCSSAMFMRCARFLRRDYRLNKKEIRPEHAWFQEIDLFDMDDVFSD